MEVHLILKKKTYTLIINLSRKVLYLSPITFNTFNSLTGIAMWVKQINFIIRQYNGCKWLNTLICNRTNQIRDSNVLAASNFVRK